MSESSSSQYVDQFSCPVCLDLLKEPVTIPCGHSYCMSCITDCWSLKEQGPPYRCPQCRESFSQRPLLKKNTLIAEMMETLQKTALQTPAAAAVDCDVCTTEKNRAVKSCLQCLASFCQTHLQPHYESPAFMKHKLVDASRHIQENICPSHGKPLEIYCQDDHQCICYLCLIQSHNGHSVGLLESEWTKRKLIPEQEGGQQEISEAVKAFKKRLMETKMACQKLIQERERGQLELSETVKFFKRSADEAVEKMEKVFTELICSLERKRSEIKEQIRAQEKTETDRAEQLHQHLHQELTQLRQTQEEIDRLLITEDQKSCESVCVLPTCEDVPSFTSHTHLSFKDLSFSEFREALEDACQQQTIRIYKEVSDVHVVKPPEPKTHNEFFRYFCQLRLDPNTANRKLLLSEDNRKVSVASNIQPYPDHPDRFDTFEYVLCKEGLTGRCYWEVEFSGNDCALGVCYKGFNRKGDVCRLGSNLISWRLSRCKQDFCFTHNNHNSWTPVVRSSRIGVYLDHRAGILSFYGVSYTMTLIHQIQTRFTEPLYPVFYSGNGSSVTII